MNGGPGPPGDSRSLAPNPGFNHWSPPGPWAPDPFRGAPPALQGGTAPPSVHVRFADGGPGGPHAHAAAPLSPAAWDEPATSAPSLAPIFPIAMRTGHLGHGGAAPSMGWADGPDPWSQRSRSASAAYHPQPQWQRNMHNLFREQLPWSQTRESANVAAAPAVVLRPATPEDSHVSVNIHTSRPHHMKPEKVLQDFQEAARAHEVMASPVYTPSGPRPPVIDLHNMLRDATDGLGANGGAHQCWSANRWSESTPATPAILPRQSFPSTSFISQPPSAAESQSSQAVAHGQAGDSAEIISIKLEEEDYDWVTSDPERKKRWVQFQKRAVCRLLDLDERRIQVLDLQRGSIQLIIRILPVSAVPELAGGDTRSVKEIKHQLDLIQDISAYLPRFQVNEEQTQAPRLQRYGTQHPAHTQLHNETLSSAVGSAVQQHGMRERILPSPPPLSPRTPRGLGVGIGVDGSSGGDAGKEIGAGEPELSSKVKEPLCVDVLDPQLKAWLLELELDHCCETMAREHIDCETLNLLSHKQLQELGVVRLGDRMKLLTRAQTLSRTMLSDSTHRPTRHKVSIQLPDIDPDKADSHPSIKLPSPTTPRSAPTRSYSATLDTNNSRNGLPDALYGFHARRFRDPQDCQAEISSPSAPPISTPAMALEGQHASCASKHFDGQDVRKKRAAERRAKFLQQGLSQEGPRSCSPPPSPTFPPPGSGPYVPLIGEPHVMESADETSPPTPSTPQHPPEITRVGATEFSPSSRPPPLSQIQTPTKVARESEQVVSGLRHMRQMLEREKNDKIQEERSPVVADLVLSCDFSIVDGKEQKFQEEIEQDICAAVGGRPDKVKVTALRAGSIVAEVLLFEGLHPEGLSALETFYDLKSQMFSTTSKLKQGTHTKYAVDFKLKDATIAEGVLPEAHPVNSEGQGITPRAIDGQSVGTAGIGLIIHDDLGSFIVKRVVKGGSAAESGKISPGDRIKEVDCKSVSTLSLPQTLDLIKGPEGSAVDLLLVAHKEDEEKLVRLTRKNMDVSNSGGSDGDKGETHGHTNGQPTATGIERQGSNGPAQSVFVTYERSKSVVTVEAPQSPIQSSPPSKGSQKRSLFSRLFNFGANGKSLEKKSGTKKDWSGSTGKMARQDGGATEKATPGTGNLGDGGEAEQWEKLGIVTKPIISRSNNEMIRHTVSEIEAGGAAAHGGIIRLNDVILQVNDMDTEKLDAKQMAALLDTASSTRNPVVFRIVRSGSRKTVAIPIKKVEHKKVEEKFPLRRNGSITLEAETGFVTTPTLSHAQTPLAVDSQRQQEGRLETPRSCDSAGGSTSGDGDRRWSVIHEGFSDALAQKSLSRTSSGLHSDFASPQIQNGGSGKPGNAPIPAICRVTRANECGPDASGEQGAAREPPQEDDKRQHRHRRRHRSGEERNGELNQAVPTSPKRGKGKQESSKKEWDTQSKQSFERFLRKAQVKGQQGISRDQ